MNHREGKRQREGKREKKERERKRGRVTKQNSPKYAQFCTHTKKNKRAIKNKEGTYH